MSTTEDTNAIDEKKNEESSQEPDFKGFINNYISSIIFTIGVVIFIIGGLGLYTTKVAQANILPDDIDLAPYTIFDRVVNDIPIDINIMRESFWAENKDTVSQKIKFNSQEYLDSFNGGLLCSIKKNADPNASFFANAPLYLSIVYDNIVAKNFLAINTIFFYLSYLPESMIMLLYGFFGIFLWIALYFFNVCISMFYHLINIPQLFRGVPENSKEWEAYDNISFLRFGKILLFFFLWIPIGLVSTFIVPIFFTLYALISPLFASYKIQKTDKSHGVMDFIKDNFAYKKYFFFILATISLFSNGLTYLGTNSIVGIAIAIAFAYFMGLYSNEIPEPGMDNFTSKIRQNMKQASVDVSYSNLVEICKPIPIINDELDNKTSGKQYRKVTTPKNVGGDIDEDFNDSLKENLYPETVSSEITPENVSTEVTPETRNKLLRNELQYLKDKRADIGQEKQWGRASQQDYDDIEREISKIESELQMQTGGKKLKNRHINHAKKYNIRLV